MKENTQVIRLRFTIALVSGAFYFYSLILKQKPELCLMEQSFFISLLLSLHSKEAEQIFLSISKKNDNIDLCYGQVGIKFVINTPGNLYPFSRGIQTYLGVAAEGCGKPSVQCQSTFL